MVSDAAFTESEKKFTSYIRKDFQPALLSRRVEGTCTWLLDTVEYRDWWSDDNSALLWITGEAGCGKTTLVNFVLETLNKQTNKKRTSQSCPLVLGFCCARDNDARNDGPSIIRGLLISIFTARRDIVHQVKRKYGFVKHEFELSLEFLWEVFMFSLSIVSCDHCYIIIDGLDECKDSSRDRLFACIATLLDTRHMRIPPRCGKIKLMFTSQPATMTEWRDCGGIANLQRVKIEERPDGLTQDITSVINHAVDSLVRRRRCSSSFAAELRAALCQKAQNSFLWVSLVLAHLKDTHMLEVNELQQLLDRRSDSLEEAYAKYLPAATPHNAKIINTCVRILVAGRRDLNMEEVRAFIAVAVQGHRLTTADQLVVFQEDLKLMFGPLLLSTDPHVQFIHPTVKRFFIRLAQTANQEISETYGTDVASAHLALADACVGYLLDQELEPDFFNDVESPTFIPSSDFEPSDAFDIQDFAFLADEEASDDEACSKLRNLFPAFDYAALNWTQHFTLCEHIASDALKLKVRLLSSPANNHTSNWYKYMEYHSMTTIPRFDCVNEILIAAMFGFSERLQELLSGRNGQVDLLEGQCKAAFFWAASRGHSRTVQIFLEHGIDPNFLESGHTPLSVAVRGGCEDVVSKLLQSPLTNPNFCDQSDRSPLSHAIAYHQHEIMGLLLSHNDLAINLADKSGCTPLLEVASSGCLLCLRRLKPSKGIDFTISDKQGRNCLLHASCANSVDTINWIVKNLTSQETKRTDASGRNASSYAAERSNLAIVKRLCELHIPISQEDINGRNAISWAASRPMTAPGDENQPVLQFLIAKSPTSVDAKDHEGWSPLLWALEDRRGLVSVKILVEVGGSDVNQQDRSGLSPLSWAAGGGLEDITRYLLQVPGIRKNLTSFSGRTPLSYAVRNCHPRTVQILLDSPGVDPHIKDDQGRSALDWARLSQHEEIIRALAQAESSP